MAELKDSGNRREFETGAVRDMQEGKGRMDLVPWGVALRIREAMSDLFYIRHYGYEVTNGKYRAVSAYRCIGPIVEYAEWMDKELNDMEALEAVRGNHQNPINRLQEIENTFVRMAATFIMFQQMTPDPMNGQNGFNHQSFSFDDKGAVTTLLNDKWLLQCLKSPNIMRMALESILKTIGGKVLTPRFTSIRLCDIS